MFAHDNKKSLSDIYASPEEKSPGETEEVDTEETEESDEE